MENVTGTKNRKGFAGMSEEKRREIASRGGKSAHEKGVAHEFTTEEARDAGHKGGTTVSADRQHMSDIGRIGGSRSRRGGRLPNRATQPTE